MSKVTTTARFIGLTGFTLLGAHASAAPLMKFQVDTVTATDLGTLGGANSSAADINNAGSIVGWAEDANGARRASLWRPGVTIDLGVYQRADSSEALGINSREQVVGFWQTAGRKRAFRYTDPGLFETLSDGSTKYQLISSKAVAINRRGEMVGQRDFVGSNYSEATLWTDPGIFYAVYSTPPFSSFVLDINDRGALVGRDKHAERADRWQWTGSAFNLTGIPRPGSGAYQDGGALGINTDGVLVGYFDTPPYTNGMFAKHAMLWDGVSSRSLVIGVLPTGLNSTADDVNSERFVVGRADRVELMIPGLFTIYVDKAFLYHADFGLYVLPQPNGAPFLGQCRAQALTDRTASGISVVGTCDGNGGTRAVRWDIQLKRVPA
jgi:probable HAF family extracellular repeat protein